MIRPRAGAADAEALGQRIAGALGEYAGTRSAVAEMTTTLCVLVVGALAFQALTPRMISMAPGVADAMARTNAIATFPLGHTPRRNVVRRVSGGCLSMAGRGYSGGASHARLGVRRRLGRLLDTVEEEFLGRGFVAAANRRN